MCHLFDEVSCVLSMAVSQVALYLFALMKCMMKNVCGAGVLAFVDGGPGGGGGSHEGLFETNQLMKRESSQGAVQRAQAAAAKARALAM